MLKGSHIFHKHGWYALKLLVFIFAMWLIIRTLAPIPHTSWNELTHKLSKTKPWLIGTILLLSIANWSIEILKWQSAIKPLHRIGFQRAARETLIAYTIGFITPLKLGEYPLKTKFYPSIHGKNVVLSHFYCHFSQLLSTILFGVIGVLYFDTTMNWFQNDFPSTIVLVVLLFTPLISKKLKKRLNLETSMPVKTAVTVFLYSLLRLVIFSFMLVLGFEIMGNQLDWSQTFFGIWTMYLLQIIAPTFSAFDIAVKSGGALIVFQGLIQAPIIIGAIVLQYVLSQILPLVMGLLIRPNSLPIR
ncbi:MAG: lysylphosphatidylglycerol synthase domain-containing protein [Bacteroidetes bacterium]|nr:lysylphosphatidylglycerol synthase domain-containing protein [Bacteroidota bacterium]MDA1209991.1 lysylphosphatidylglycerol synthase domain-containing protein [Bacteroidota bacterium]